MSPVSRISPSPIYPHKHQSNFRLVISSVFLSLLHPHTTADQSGRIIPCTLLSPVTTMLSLALTGPKRAAGPWPPAPGPAGERAVPAAPRGHPGWELSTGRRVLKEPGNAHSPALCYSRTRAEARREIPSNMLPVSTCRLLLHPEGKGQERSFTLAFPQTFRNLSSHQKRGETYPYNSALCSYGAFLI